MRKRLFYTRYAYRVVAIISYENLSSKPVHPQVILVYRLIGVFQYTFNLINTYGVLLLASSPKSNQKGFGLICVAQKCVSQT